MQASHKMQFVYYLFLMLSILAAIVQGSVEENYTTQFTLFSIAISSIGALSKYVTSNLQSQQTPIFEESITADEVRITTTTW